MTTHVHVKHNAVVERVKQESMYGFFVPWLPEQKKVAIVERWQLAEVIDCISNPWK